MQYETNHLALGTVRLCRETASTGGKNGRNILRERWRERGMEEEREGKKEEKERRIGKKKVGEEN